MTEDPSEKAPEERHRANMMALTFLLRQMAGQLIQEGQVPEARGFVDLLESLQVKTKGNLDPEEEKLLESVLFELRMAVVRGKEAPTEEASGETGEAESGEVQRDETGGQSKSEASADRGDPEAGTSE